ncbi:prolyl oligopeptidase family serine peptidase [Parabacteroides bouchesdurhonensis]|uniref:S9 family peptidase n=1 Tax=Parabacteroides bouchesdurhonensis TaxID=1936995 RepID=UPI000C83C135|nr:prolyl oligopeptidase family serine peptidase [Parabacteroides bouchesdurhonensis]
MKNLKYIAFIACMSLSLPAFAQRGTGKAMTFENLEEWNRITEKSISDDGKWVTCKMEPWIGDPTIKLYNTKGDEVASFCPAERAAFSSSSKFLVAIKKLGVKEKDSLMLHKTKEEKMPMNQLIILPLTGKEEIIDSLRNHQLAESADWIAYQCGRTDSTLYLRSLDGTKTFQFPAVTGYGFARKSGNLFYTTTQEAKPGLYTLNPDNGTPVLIKEGNGTFKQTVFNENGDHIAFLYCAEKDSSYKDMQLWLSANNAPAELIATRGNEAFPQGWIVSENGTLQFSKNSARLFFGTAPEPQQKDTTILEENRPNVQVWSWNEPIQYTVQNVNKDKELKRSYRAVYNIADRHLVQLANKKLPEIELGDEGNSDIALLYTSQPYALPSMWESRVRSDYYTVAVDNGERKPLLTADYGRLALSPSGKYAYWYAKTDSCWYTITLASGTKHRLTTPQSFVAWDEENDQPNYPVAYGSAGWTTDDRYLLVYDRYDLWRFDPEAATAPVNLTVNGRKEHISYHLVIFDKEERYIDLSKPQILTGYNETTKGSGYYQSKLSSPAVPKTLLAGNFMLNKPIKAKKADAIVYTSETFEQYPDLRLTNISFKNPVQLTHGDRQQDGLLWGTAELVSWVSLDGTPLQGVVYKPANFDPSRKYPMIVNFYERNSETLYEYRMPEPGRSTVDYHFYNSHDYIIFNPDVRYVDGYPGQSCFNCVMPGVSMMIATGYVDEKAIGAQGHSWGGYQVAYLATRTNLFAAIESGAPVVNMFSAYGGIRWWSGLNRSFQYEHTQSRIGGTPWSAPLQYLENSPLFNTNKVQTPILIMHNDADGHVPWYQGIEYFVALKRLHKTAWLLNYPGSPHWPEKMVDRVDFQKRMFQFFEHYLTGKPMPKWMSEGVKATEQPFELGY